MTLMDARTSSSNFLHRPDARRRLSGLLRGSRFVAAVLLAVLICAGPISCSDESAPAEQQIRMLNDKAEAAVRARDVSDLKGMIADEYSDERGNNKQSMVRVAQLYLLRNRTIHLLSVEKSLQVLDDDNAVAEVFVAMAGEPISTAEQLFNLRADLVRFDVRYVRVGGDWKVSGLGWRKASIDDFL